MSEDEEVWGRLVAAPTIERGLECTLRYWLSPYIGAVLAQAGHPRDALPDPSDLVRVSEFPRDIPAGSPVTLVIVATPGTEGQAVREPTGYTATWDVRAAILANLGDRLESREAAQFFAAAASAAMTHQGIAAVEADMRTWKTDDDGRLLILPGSSVIWRGETYRAMVDRGSGTLQAIAGEARVSVIVQGARSAWGGPDVPPDPPRDPAVPGVSGPVVPFPVVERL